MMVYSVRSEFSDPQTRQRYLDWLTGGHAQALITQGGALRAEVALLDDGCVETRYLFASREAFAAYEAGPAVALRADSVAKFPPSADIRTTRSTGDLAGLYDS
ncbi:hypothetical protein Rhe02_24320 [Rhizocola hellebori]|uniref:DUF4286 family protein n=1 Tax=Rhizocola hellebori TaxID=1392758 RepID=A0A8J3Q5S8_9ACTN|nr:DUF4286 domain-containing protein [Rhizocola hellebori]GIH04365.1 hypothetical protein Rhe02_24320 [Rhizocola hellebori]